MTYLRAGVNVAGDPREALVCAVDGDLGVAPDAGALPGALGARKAHKGQGHDDQQQGRGSRGGPAVAGRRRLQRHLQGDRSGIIGIPPVGRK